MSTFATPPRNTRPPNGSRATGGHRPHAAPHQAPRLSGWLIVLACAIAGALGLCEKRPALAAGSTKPTSSASAAPASAKSTTAGSKLHGLHPVFDDHEVPSAWLPPGAMSLDTGPSQGVYPPQKITVRFNHKEHVKGQSLKCDACHKAKKSTLAADNLLPDGTTCDPCHNSDHTDPTKVTAEEGTEFPCGFCHLGFQEKAKVQVVAFEMPKPNMTFNHKVHIDRNIACAQCHGSVDELELATRDQLPRMKGCFDCHQKTGPAKGEAKSDCLTCHLREPDGRMKTMFASGTLEPPRWMHNAEHAPDFIERHKRVAADDSQFCASCHAEQFCTDCHDGRVKPRTIHPNDFISMHPVAARQDNPRCTSCHQEQSFCLSCHQRVGVTMSGPNVQGKSFHPLGWADLTARGPGHHAWEAERNLSACVSCHTERDCTTCHAGSGRQGLAIAIHPAGFAASCSSLFKRNARPCLVCHEPDSPDIAQCR